MQLLEEQQRNQRLIKHHEANVKSLKWEAQADLKAKDNQIETAKKLQDVTLKTKARKRDNRLILDKSLI